MSLTPKIPSKTPTIVELEAGTYYWCTCGCSAGQPFCDGSHAGTGFVPMRFEIEEKRKVALCNCKHTGGQPFCDGKHKSL